ncbi:DUF4304 domain-containing protein [Solitalea canadensis]|uniref:DUF4304 domain-containing protein n=1 Tax=Solitalea canadensis (strain ATCC 29591 / DSM 3403 / JCM 21819 / LMG 8368 / NBRC 15130 / NCIMB 12057 / USAM 9D) TaxID=929556 RepID=H8KTP6_SOLCM|nr:DUF4304 domain-containing protein [Solitalea canadensis]AFD06621.1 hypothetical protein Solca_1548 [Solitalea canadensis DSM 3403]
MDSKIFKKTVANFLIGKGFSKKGSYYYLFFKDLAIVVGFQKSNFSNDYYINIGYVISELNSNLLTPRDVDGDVRARFSVELEGKKVDSFNLDKLTVDMLINAIDENIKHYVLEITSIEKLKLLLQENSIMLYQTKLAAKQLLKLE